MKPQRKDKVIFFPVILECSHNQRRWNLIIKTPVYNSCSMTRLNVAVIESFLKNSQHYEKHYNQFKLERVCTAFHQGFVLRKFK